MRELAREDCSASSSASRHQHDHSGAGDSVVTIIASCNNSIGPSNSDPSPTNYSAVLSCYHIGARIFGTQSTGCGSGKASQSGAFSHGYGRMLLSHQMTTRQAFSLMLCSARVYAVPLEVQRARATRPSLTGELLRGAGETLGGPLQAMHLLFC